ncbi:hypothetical protein [Alloactinosynnema sp. L-07]|nr:hypothetical protein [Alloactinosynnema sp. L-07]
MRYGTRRSSTHPGADRRRGNASWPFRNTEMIKRKSLEHG